jgi:hypothetical protein
VHEPERPSIAALALLAQRLQLGDRLEVLRSPRRACEIEAMPTLAAIE